MSKPTDNQIDPQADEPAFCDLYPLEPVDCSTCRGSGRGMPYADRDERGPFVNADYCDDCDGDGVEFVERYPAGLARFEMEEQSR